MVTSCIPLRYYLKMVVWKDHLWFGAKKTRFQIHNPTILVKSIIWVNHLQQNFLKDNFGPSFFLEVDCWKWAKNSRIWMKMINFYSVCKNNLCNNLNHGYIMFHSCLCSCTNFEVIQCQKLHIKVWTNQPSS